MQAARGENCTLRLPHDKGHDPETVVFCHFPDGSGGSNRLTGPLNGGFGCFTCHGLIDHRIYLPGLELTAADRERAMRLSNLRTINRLIELGLVTVKGLG